MSRTCSELAVPALPERTLEFKRRAESVGAEPFLPQTGSHLELRVIKHGDCGGGPGRELAWLVGDLERDGSVVCFALNMEGEEVWERWGQPSARRQLVDWIFRELGVVSDE